jgi:Arc/MetJ-type ribon-helix-helix transcriptional regulator
MGLERMPSTSIRLDDDLERMVADAARQLNVTRSEVIRQSIRHYCGRVLAEAEVYPWDLMKDLVGGFHNGRGDLARDSSKDVKEIIRAQHAKRRRTN